MLLYLTRMPVKYVFLKLVSLKKYSESDFLPSSLIAILLNITLRLEGVKFALWELWFFFLKEVFYISYIFEILS